MMEIEHPPHVNRLLRLIREGSSSHASRASDLLGRYAASYCNGGVGDDGHYSEKHINPSTIVWDLIGRLVVGDGTNHSNISKGNRKSSSGLFDSNWETRSNCALALQSVARCLPYEDRRSFFQGVGNDGMIHADEDADESSLWLTVYDLQNHLHHSQNTNIMKEKKEMQVLKHRTKRRSVSTATQSSSKEFSSVRNLLDIVIEEGRLLMSSSGESYDWIDDEIAQEYIREQEVLQSLDATALTRGNDLHGSINQSRQHSFLHKRVLLQRQILAQRLGLGGILSSPIVIEDNVKCNKKDLLDEIVEQNDLIPEFASSSSPINENSTGKALPERCVDPLKRSRPVKDKTEYSTKNRSDQNELLDIRALLVLECNRSAQEMSILNGNQKNRYHRNPQTLLGSELAYRTFDSQWTVRHGALLGTLSLLRAWRVHDSSHKYSLNVATNEEPVRRQKIVFGKWPHDILARCICILALDRFTDFSGASLQKLCRSSTKDNSIDEHADSITNDVIVAPVREMAAQIIATILEAAPSEVWQTTHELMSQLYTKTIDRELNGWEVRHGVLLVWKYVCVIARLHSPKENSLLPPSLRNSLCDNTPSVQTIRPLSTRATCNSLSLYHTIYDSIILHCISGLSDGIDDVRALAAQVLLQLLKADKNSVMMNIVTTCSHPVWQAISMIRIDVSSCAPDLLVLFAEILSENCHDVMRCLKEKAQCDVANEQGNVSLNAILLKLSSFINFNSIPVKMSCFKALSLIIAPIVEEAILIADECESASCNVNMVSLTILCSTLSELVKRLFENIIVHSIDGEDMDASTTLDDGLLSSVNPLFIYRDHAWVDLADSLATILCRIKSNCKVRNIITNTIVSLTLRYFDVCKETPPHAYDTNDMKIFSNDSFSSTCCYKHVRAYVSIADVTITSNNAYFSKLAASRALALFYMKISSKSTALKQEIITFISLTMRTILQSPWLSQCEAGCLLHIAILSLCDRFFIGTSNPLFLDYLQSLSSINMITPNCILLDNAFNSSVIRDANVMSLCDDGLSALFNCAFHSRTGEVTWLLSENIIKLWKNLFEQRGVSVEESRLSSSSPTKSTMRIAASISGAIVYCGDKYLPDKVTPLIRNLMTSLKNEESVHRRMRTSYYVSRLVLILSNNIIHNNARNKLIENLCILASNGSMESLDKAPSSSLAARETLRLLVTNMSSSSQLQDFPAVWGRLTPLLQDIESNLSEQQLSESILMISIISNALRKEHHCFEFFVSSFAKPIVSVASYTESLTIKTQASSSMTYLLRSDFEFTMGVIISSLLSTLSNLKNDTARKGACELLVSLLESFTVSASPFVKVLLPVVMRLMTDVSEECSRYAANAFAILVRIAPLSINFIHNNEKNLSCHHGGSCSVPEDVISHLILGKPIPPIKLPDAIYQELSKSSTILRPYQIEGISWLKFLQDVQLNGALCDDMGLGKTLQSLTSVALSHFSPSDEKVESMKKSLIVCPSSVVGHWVSEIKRFFPGSKILIPFNYTEAAKIRRERWNKCTQPYTIVVTSYSILRTDIDILDEFIWNYCILDEGHLLKNPSTATAKASRRIKAQHKLVLTGTLIQNNVNELWATFDFLMPNFLGSESSFINEFARPIIKSQDSNASADDINKGMECLKTLHQQVLPFILRREKSQVMDELPPKIITDIPCSLSSTQQQLYLQVVEKDETKAALNLVDSAITNTGDSLVQLECPRKRGDALASLLQLRLICTHPILYSLFTLKSNDKTQRALPLSLSLTRLDCSGKFMALSDILRHAGIAGCDITAADNDESVYFVGTNDDPVSSNDIIDTNDYEENYTAESFDDGTCNDDAISTAYSKCLIFAQFNQSLDLVEKFLFEPHMPALKYLRLDGGVPINQRIRIIEKFNQDPEVKVLLLTTKVGGLGLTLTGADKVIFLEPDWNPFVDLQAMDRAHRIGQTRVVNVYRLITTDTVEEKIMQLQQRKIAVSESVVTSENSTMYSMGTDRLLDIFTYRGSCASSHPISKKGDYDNVLSYLDDEKSNEYASFTVEYFIRGLS